MIKNVQYIENQPGFASTGSLMTEHVVFDLEDYSLKVVKKAYELYAQGGDVGIDLRNWLQAEQQV